MAFAAAVALCPPGQSQPLFQRPAQPPGRPQGQPAPVQPNPAANAAYERQDLGVPPPQGLYAGPMHGPTPATLPGGQVITTEGVLALVQGRQTPYVVLDVLGGPVTLPGAVPAAWMHQPGSFDDALQQQVAGFLQQVTRGQIEMPLVFYCQSRECWMSYNAALRALRAGYRNVLWYRGGIEAWQAAQLPTTSGYNPPGANRPPQPPPSGLGPSGLGPSAQPDGPGGGFTRVRPAVAGGSSGTGARPSHTNPGPLSIRRGPVFAYAIAPGWRVVEEGQFALSLYAGDNSALTLLVGNANVLLSTQPVQYARTMLMGTRPREVQMGQPQDAQPLQGFARAVGFDFSLVTADGVPMSGRGKVSWNPGYDGAVMAFNAAVSRREFWADYSRWLPLVSEQVQALNGSAFGIRGAMAQNLENSKAFGRALAEHRQWSADLQKGVAAEKARVWNKQRGEWNDAVGGVNTYTHPYGQPPVELPSQYKYYWADRNGEYVGTNDPGIDPNVGSTGEWRRMSTVQR